MKVTGPAARLTVFVGAADQWDHRPVHLEIVRRAQEAGLAGVTVLRGIEGYGASTHVHSSGLLLGDDLPIAVVIVDQEEAIRAFVRRLDEVVDEGLVVLDRVQAHRFVRMDPDRLLPRHRLTDRLHWPRGPYRSKNA